MTATDELAKLNTPPTKALNMGGAFVFLNLSRGRVAVIDAADFERVGRFKWSFQKGGYAIRRCPRRQKFVYLHQEILGVSGVDHRDGDGLNNRRYNLRPGGQAFNSRALRRKSKGKTSKYRGVSWKRREGRWAAQVQDSRKQWFLGLFRSERAAAIARDRAATRLGFPPEGLNFPKVGALTKPVKRRQ